MYVEQMLGTVNGNALGLPERLPLNGKGKA